MNGVPHVNGKIGMVHSSAALPFSAIKIYMANLCPPIEIQLQFFPFYLPHSLRDHVFACILKKRN